MRMRALARANAEYYRRDDRRAPDALELTRDMVAPNSEVSQAFPDEQNFETESGGRLLEERYREVAAALQAESRALDSDDIDDAGVIAGALGRALLDRVTARSTSLMIQLVVVAMLVGLVGFAVAFGQRKMGGLPTDPYGFGTLYFLVGFLGAGFMALLSIGSESAADRRFERAAANLIALVARTTGEFRDRLAPLRALMQSGGRNDLAQAVTASSQARILTVAALRFFDRSPVVGVDAEGYRCRILAGELEDAARAGAGGFGRGVIALIALGLGALAGALALYFSIEPPFDLRPPPDILDKIINEEHARPGVILIPLAIAAALILPTILGQLAAVLGAAAGASAILSIEPARGLANSLQARALTAAAEPRRIIIERYADALDALERRLGH